MGRTEPCALTPTRLPPALAPQAKAAEFGGRDMMTSLWALQRLGYRPSPAVLSALCRPMETTLADYNSQVLAPAPLLH